MGNSSISGNSCPHSQPSLLLHFKETTLGVLQGPCCSHDCSSQPRCSFFSPEKPFPSQAAFSAGEGWAFKFGRSCSWCPFPHLWVALPFLWICCAPGQVSCLGWSSGERCLGAAPARWAAWPATLPPWLCWQGECAKVTLQSDPGWCKWVHRADSLQREVVETPRTSPPCSLGYPRVPQPVCEKRWGV